MRPNAKYSQLGLYGGGLGAVIAWAWNAFVGDPSMPPEIAAILGGMLSGVVGRFLPASDRG